MALSQVSNNSSVLCSQERFPSFMNTNTISAMLSNVGTNSFFFNIKFSELKSESFFMMSTCWEDAQLARLWIPQYTNSLAFLISLKMGGGVKMQNSWRPNKYPYEGLKLSIKCSKHKGGGAEWAFFHQGCWDLSKYSRLRTCFLSREGVHRLRDGFTKKSCCSFGFCPNYLPPPFVQLVQ